MRTSKKHVNLFGVTLVTLAIFCPAVYGKTWTVGKPNTACPGATNDTIAAAITAAGNGDLIEICPAIYPEQLVITKPLTLRGVSQQGIGRAVIQPLRLSPVAGIGTAVITVMNTSGVTIQNLAIDAGNNTTTGCGITLAGIHFYNASGTIDSGAIYGTKLTDPRSCATLFPGNGFGVQIDQETGATANFRVSVWNTSIYDFTRNGILVRGARVTVDLEGNVISGIGPASGTLQFGIFVADGASGLISANAISQGTCGSIPILDCFDVRSEGVVLRSAGDGVVVSGNIISNTQSGIFVNGAANARVTANMISNVDALSAIHIQGSTSGLFTGNRIFHVGPFTADTSADEEGCGINDVSGTNSSANTIRGNWVNDSYCGVAYVTGDRVQENVYQNTLYETLNGDNYPDTFPPAVPPGPKASAALQAKGLRRGRIDQ